MFVYMSKIGAEVKQAGAGSAGKPSKHAWLCVSMAGRQAGARLPPPSCGLGRGRSAGLRLQEDQACQHQSLAELQSLSLQPLISCSSVSLGEWVALCCSEGGGSVCE